MTFVIKQRSLDNGYYVTIEQTAFSTSYHVNMYSNHGRRECWNVYGDIDKAKRCFYSYISRAKKF